MPRKALIVTLLPFALVPALFLRGRLQENTNVTEPSSATSSEILMRDVAAQFDLTFTHRIQNTSNDYLSRDDALGSLEPGAFVTDLNRDTFQDVVFVGSSGPSEVRVFLNQGGLRFEEVTEQEPFRQLAQIKKVSALGFADFNGDGVVDVYVGRLGCDRILLSSRLKMFSEQQEVDADPCDYSRSINIFDFDKNGLLDVAVGSYSSPKADRNVPETVLSVGDKVSGGRSFLLLNVGSSSPETRLISAGRPYTTAVGVADIDSDGWLDLFLSNDYSTDELYLNNKGLTLVDVTARRMPYSKHGFSGMNSEFFDVNGDGLVDLLVSNIYKPPFHHFGNLLWINKGTHFEEQADELGLRRCGWAWGAKFVDFDLDGQAELLMAAGRFLGPKFNVSEPKSYWYRRVLERMTPPFLRKHLDQGSGKLPLDEFDFSGRERYCLFQKFEKRYFDITESTSETGHTPSRAVALIDVDNNGVLEAIVTHYGGDVQLLQNRSSSLKPNWIGFDMASNGIFASFGARITLRADNDTRILFLHPNNGYLSQSDHRVVFGFKSRPQQWSVQIETMDGKKKLLVKPSLNQYNQVSL